MNIIYIYDVMMTSAAAEQFIGFGHISMFALINFTDT